MTNKEKILLLLAVSVKTLTLEEADEIRILARKTYNTIYRREYYKKNYSKKLDK